MKCKLPIKANSHSNHLSPPESVRRTKSAPTRFWIWVQRLVPWDSSINTSTIPMALYLGHSIILVLKLIFFISKGPKHSILELSLQVLDLGIEWSQDPSFMCESHIQACLGYWIFILHACYSWSFAPRWLEVALELSLCVMSLGKFVLPLCDSEQLKVWSWWSLEWGKGWERPDSLWAPQWGRNILYESEPRDKISCLLCPCIYFLYRWSIYLLVESSL
jgi:hypothetical protein